MIAADGTLAKVMRKVKPDTHADDVLAALAGRGGLTTRCRRRPWNDSGPSRAPITHADER